MDTGSLEKMDVRDPLNDLRMSEKAVPLYEAVKKFIAKEVEPMSVKFHALGEGRKDRWSYVDGQLEMLEEVKNKAKSQGLWNFFLPDAETGEGSWGVEVISSSITSPGSTSNLSDYPHQFWSEGLMRGYIVLDIQPERVHVDWYGYFDVFKAFEDLPQEDWWKGYVTAAGANHLVEVDEPAPDKTNAPELAPIEATESET